MDAKQITYPCNTTKDWKGRTLQFARLTIPGEYWDSYLYSSKLYLFGLNSDIAIIQWKQLIMSLNIHDDLLFALQCAFTNSEWLYGPKFRILFRDREIRELIQRKFQRLSAIDLVADRSQLQNAKTSHQEFHQTFPFNDLYIYRSFIYTSSSDGIFYDPINSGARTSRRMNPSRLWDCPSVSISASYSNMAAATGPEGLYRISVRL